MQDACPVPEHQRHQHPRKRPRSPTLTAEQRLPARGAGSRSSALRCLPSSTRPLVWPRQLLRTAGIMPPIYTKRKWFQDIQIAETNLNEIAGLKAAISIVFG